MCSCEVQLGYDTVWDDECDLSSFWGEYWLLIGIDVQQHTNNYGDRTYKMEQPIFSDAMAFPCWRKSQLIHNLLNVQTSFATSIIDAIGLIVSR